MLLQALDAGHGASEVGASPDGRQPCFGLGFPCYHPIPPFWDGKIYSEPVYMGIDTYFDFTAKTMPMAQRRLQIADF